MTQNVTLRLDKQLLEAARMLAAARNLSLSELVAEWTRKSLAQDAAFRARRKRFRQRLERGFDLQTGGKVALERDEFHGRR